MNQTSPPPASSDTGSNGSRGNSTARQYIKIIMTSIIAAAALKTFFLESFSVTRSTSELLYDTSHDDHLFLLKPAYLFSSPARGDLISFSWRGERRISRIVGLPGETVDISPGGTRIDGKLLKEPYALVYGLSTYRVIVPKRHVFVEPDNRAMLVGKYIRGSAYWGAIPYDEIGGKYWLRYRPLRRIGFIKQPREL